jgi:hypothetical protein
VPSLPSSTPPLLLAFLLLAQVPPALDIVKGSLAEARTGKPVELHGLNWFGWETDTPGFDGLWVSLWEG